MNLKAQSVRFRTISWSEGVQQQALSLDDTLDLVLFHPLPIDHFEYLNTTQLASNSDAAIKRQYSVMSSEGS